MKTILGPPRRTSPAGFCCILVGMSILVKTTPAPKTKTNDTIKVAYLYVAILVAFALLQLFTFDKFLDLIENFGMPGGEPMAHLVGSLIVVSEVFALPFLLRLDLSRLMRVVSMVFGWLVPLAWLKLSLWVVLTSSTVNNIGFLGTKIQLMPGWWAVFFSVAMGILAVWVSWGMWPIPKGKQSKK